MKDFSEDLIYIAIFNFNVKDNFSDNNNNNNNVYSLKIFNYTAFMMISSNVSRKTLKKIYNQAIYIGVP